MKQDNNEKKIKKKWSKYRIINVTVITLLFVLTLIFTGLYAWDQKKFMLYFFIFLFLFALWVVGYFTAHFFFANADSIKEGAKKLTDDYRRKPKIGKQKTETTEEKIKRLEQEIKDLKEKKE